MDLIDLVKYGVENRASDIHITVGIPPVLRIDGSLVYHGRSKLNPDDTKMLVEQVLNEKQLEELEDKGEIDSSYSSHGIGRFRINAYKQRGSYGMSIRVIPLKVPTIEELGIPPVVKKLARLPRGLILVTGPTGSGKSTTLASIVNLINEEKNCHILTLEDPIEYLHKHNRSIVNQREIGLDTFSFASGLRSALRQDPDVILVGEMRDLDTISIALTAAETGHLVLSTLHTIGAAKTIDRIIDVFPPHQQQQIRVQLSSVIQAIISQHLLPKSNGKGRVAAFEIMVANPAIRNLIREEKIHQIDTSIQTGGKHGMQTMDSSLLELYNKGIISKDTVLNQAVNLETIRRYIF
ncbi:type IV pilus twitching motility protein PilT [Clostridium sp. Cult1]|uniref:type IV pilus twitching motility protein PilT n=1 Tax=Clostridium sp. Cult1 TaxID=2079002 RepID=UPI001F171855|nr:type IV pilus twitching motility protein PilT [Clostridium sp. Cult1]MCF6464222.1 type IV pili twitching motility protein PilT [Clostridium sp. Cult1]